MTQATLPPTIQASCKRCGRSYTYERLYIHQLLYWKRGRLKEALPGNATEIRKIAEESTIDRQCLCGDFLTRVTRQESAE